MGTESLPSPKSGTNSVSPPGPALPTARPRVGRSSRQSSTGGFLIAHHPPGGVLRRRSVELRWEGLRDKVLRSGVAALARGRARPFRCSGWLAGVVRHECAPYGVVRCGTSCNGGGVDSPGWSSISQPVPEAIPGLFIGVGGPREGMPVGPQGQRTTPFDNIEGDQR